MKKSLLTLLGAGLLLTSCQSDEPFAPVEGGEKQVTFTLNVPGELGTRAGDSGNNSGVGGFTNKQGNVSYTLVLSAEGHNQTYKKENVAGNTVTFSPTVILGREYTVTAYAHFSATAQEDLKNIAVTKDFNDESKDVYFFTTSERASDPTIDFATEGTDHTFTLKRPFGKLRLVATDYQATGNGNTAIKSVKVKYNNNVFTTFNAVSGEFSNGQSYEHTLDGTNYSTSYYAPEKDENGDVIGQTIFADYIPVQLRGDHAAPFKITVEYQDGGTYTREFPQDIPVRRNALTTLKGNFFTANSEIKVEVKDAFEGQIPGNAEEQLIIAAAMGGSYTLPCNVTLSKPLKVQADMVLNLNGKTITTTEKETGRHHYAIDNYATLVIEGEGAINARGIQNFGEMTINGDITITNVDTNGGAAIWNEGRLTINNGTFTTNDQAGVGSYGAALNTRPNGEAVVNGGTFEAYSQLTYAIINEGKTVINNATVKGKHGAVCGSETNDQTTINGGSFELMENPGVSDHCAYYVSNIKGGSFTLGNNTDCGAQVFYESTIAAGYKALKVDNLYYVLLEAIADAASTANVTLVTESTADIATALATNNGEAAMFMWNDVAYIAKYGEVNIMASEDGEDNTTSRGVVENSTALTSATVAERIEVLGNRTFRKCANLETVALPNTLTEIGPAVFQSCSKLANVTIPATVKTIGEGAFAECTSLASINIPNGITRLEKDVLRNTGLTSIEIPASVNYIGTYAFRDCESLTEVKILSPEFTIENNSFTNSAAPVPTMTIKVVNEEMKAYLESVLTNYDKSYITVVM